jgi:hypothetical protein
MFLSFLCLLLKMRLDLTNESKYKKKTKISKIQLSLTKKKIKNLFTYKKKL